MCRWKYPLKGTLCSAHFFLWRLRNNLENCSIPSTWMAHQKAGISAAIQNAFLLFTKCFFGHFSNSLTKPHSNIATEYLECTGKVAHLPCNHIPFINASPGFLQVFHSETISWFCHRELLLFFTIGSYCSLLLAWKSYTVAPGHIPAVALFVLFPFHMSDSNSGIISFFLPA